MNSGGVQEIVEQSFQSLYLAAFSPSIWLEQSNGALPEFFPNLS